jgi:N-acetylglucosaminyl-diphospho-decaprenol L-rhamnosyltransferase
MEQPTMDVSVVIVSYNTADLICSCIDSVKMQKNVSFEIIVVDNASSDKSVQAIRTCGEQANLIVNSDNIGFGRANNLAFKKARGRYVFLLNPDARFIENIALEMMVHFMDAHPKFGIVGTMILEGDEQINPYLHYPYHKFISGDYSELPGDIAWITGASMMTRAEVIAETGGFDEDFFLYWEETDWCLRIRQAGYAVGYNPEVVVEHIQGASEQNISQYDYALKRQNSVYLFCRKNYSLEENRRIVCNRLRRSAFQMVRLWLKNIFLKLNSNDIHKMEKHRAKYDSSKIFKDSLM